MLYYAQIFLPYHGGNIYCFHFLIAALSGHDVEEFHCYLTSAEGKVWLDPCGKALCAVNGKVIEEPIQLKQGMYSWNGFSDKWLYLYVSIA